MIRTKFHLRILIIYLLIIAMTPEIKKKNSGHHIAILHFTGIIPQQIMFQPSSISGN